MSGKAESGGFSYREDPIAEPRESKRIQSIERFLREREEIERLRRQYEMEAEEEPVEDEG